MLHWPEKYKWIEGKQANIRYLQGFIRHAADISENFFIRTCGLPREGIYKGKERDEKIIISLTSFPKRIDSSYYAIKSLMHQSVKADKIILWLSTQQFPNLKIPDKFDKLKNKGLEIKFVNEDLKSHKKYYYILQEQRPNEIVITFDDDLIYGSTAVEKLINRHKEFPENVICNRGLAVSIDTEGKINRKVIERLYDDEGVDKPSFYIIPSTGAGCLYPYGVMPESTFVKDDLKTMAFSADDIWIWYNCLLAKKGIVKSQKISRALVEIKDSQIENLNQLNDMGGENDRILSRLDFTKTPLTK